MKKVFLPGPTGDPVEFSDVSSLVLVGANGSGKSRLGVWIDGIKADGIVVHRVSAQRALTIGEFITARPLELAKRLFVIGNESPNVRYGQKFSYRWGDDPAGHLLNDFDIVLSLLLADHSEHSIKFRDTCRETKTLANLAESRLENVVRIWNGLMPQRKLAIRDNKVIACNTDGSGEYHGKSMSDGEKVALYLVAECLAAPSDAIIVIDEPELHLHQAIQSKLWDLIEAARPDCVFVYVTHDLDFATTRVAATKIWVDSFDGKKWTWQPIEATPGLPESMVLKILGSRRPIVFVEGENSSLDIAIYRRIFPDRLVIPRSSCRHVVDSTVSLNSLPQLHHADAIGIVDRDHRSDEELSSYEDKRVFSSHVAEVENLLLLPEVIRIVSKHLGRDPDDDLRACQNFIFNELESQLSVQVNDRAVFQIQQKLNSFGGLTNRKCDDLQFKAEVTSFLGSIDPRSFHAVARTLFEDVIARRDYLAALKFFNGKSLAGRASKLLGLADSEYPKIVVRLLGLPEGEPIIAVLRSAFPKVS